MVAWVARHLKFDPLLRVMPARLAMATKGRTNTTLTLLLEVASLAVLLLQLPLLRRLRLRLASARIDHRLPLRNAFGSGRTVSTWVRSHQATTRSVKNSKSRTVVVPLRHRAVSRRRRCLATALKTLTLVASTTVITLRRPLTTHNLCLQ
jgi:hypothetical protein